MEGDMAHGPTDQDPKAPPGEPTDSPPPGNQDASSAIDAEHSITCAARTGRRRAWQAVGALLSELSGCAQDRSWYGRQLGLLTVLRTAFQFLWLSSADYTFPSVKPEIKYRASTSQRLNNARSTTYGADHPELAAQQPFKRKTMIALAFGCLGVAIIGLIKHNTIVTVVAVVATAIFGILAGQ